MPAPPGPMRYKDTWFNRVGRSGLKVSDIGVGCWKFGYPGRGDLSLTDERDAWAILDKALELGMTFWDTADRYNNMSGNSERIIGRWFAANPNERENIVLATKVAGMMNGVTPNHEGLSRTHVIEGVNHSLKRLQTTHIDLLQCHSPDPECPVEESLRAVADLMAQDKVRYLGVSNFTVAQLEEFLKTAEERFLPRIVSVQNCYNALEGERGGQGQSGVVDFCAKAGLGFIPFSPLARSILTGRYLEREPAPGDRAMEGNLKEVAASPKAKRVCETLTEIGRAHGKNCAQTALAWLLSHPSICTVIPTPRTVSQLVDNHSATGYRLNAEEMAQVKASQE